MKATGARGKLSGAKAGEWASPPPAMSPAAGGGAQFSIREYAVRARAGAADERSKCWPFGKAAGPLPPMEVRRFRWWADEAALAAELEVEEEEEERRKAAMRRKRSIVELFAAVPPVGAGKRKLDKEKLVAAGGLPKKRFKKEKAPVGAETTAVRKKEKSGNIKVTSLSISQLFQDAIQKRKLKKSPSKKKRNQEVSVLPNKKSMKGSKKSVLPDQKAIKNSCQVQIILKKHLRTEIGAFLKNKDVTCTPKSSCKLKHVTFSDMDGICGLTASQSKDNTEQSQLMQASQQPSQKGNSQIVNGQHNTEETQLVHPELLCRSCAASKSCEGKQTDP